MKVCIITCCRSPDELYGSSLVFSSLRTGFPTASCLVLDNGSCPEARPALAAAAARAGAIYREAVPSSHANVLGALIASAPEPVVFCDPDIVFWDNVEPDLDDGGASPIGRVLPAFMDREFMRPPRWHPSLFCVPDPDALNARLRDAQARYQWADFFAPVMVPEPDSGRWLFYDTLAVLYLTDPDQRAFTPGTLDKYDHIFVGSHLADTLAGRAAEDPIAAGLRRWHASARAGRLDELRGIWREQQTMFQALDPRTV